MQYKLLHYTGHVVTANNVHVTVIALIGLYILIHLIHIFHNNVVVLSFIY